jgi:hypothetical protein
MSANLGRTLTARLVALPFERAVILQETHEATSLRLGGLDSDDEDGVEGVVSATKAPLALSEALISPGLFSGISFLLPMIVVRPSLHILVSMLLSETVPGATRMPLSASLTHLALYPLDLMRTLRSVGDERSMRDLVREEGISRLYAGAAVSVAGDFVFRAAHQTASGVATAFLRSRFDGGGDGRLSLGQLMFVGFTGTAIARIVCHPMDVVRRNQMVTAESALGASRLRRGKRGLLSSFLVGLPASMCGYFVGYATTIAVFAFQNG